VALTADGKTVASGSADSTIRMWAVETGKARLVIPQSRPVVSMVMTPDGRLIASAGLTEGKIRLWSGTSREEVAVLDTFGPLVIAGDGKILVTGAGRQWVHVWDLSGLAER
jgi:WD40 repeat protein